MPRWCPAGVLRLPVDDAPADAHAIATSGRRVVARLGLDFASLMLLLMWPRFRFADAPADAHAIATSGRRVVARLGLDLSSISPR